MSNSTVGIYHSPLRHVDTLFDDDDLTNSRGISLATDVDDVRLARSCCSFLQLETDKSLGVTSHRRHHRQRQRQQSRLLNHPNRRQHRRRRPRGCLHSSKTHAVALATMALAVVMTMMSSQGPQIVTAETDVNSNGPSGGGGGGESTIGEGAVDVEGNSSSSHSALHDDDDHSHPNAQVQQRRMRGESLKNPYTDGGCLKQLKSNWTKKRVCSSDDPPEFVEMGYCEHEETFNYTEIRISSQNWESAFFQTWILQVILSEILGVPTTVETGLPDVKVGLYDPDARFEYGLIDDFGCLETGNEMGDCRPLLFDQINRDGSDKYVSCCHFIPEVWESDITKLQRLEEKNIIEPPQGVGTIGEQWWYVPKFTAIRDPSLLSYIGLAGEGNRAKLAARFKRPTRWGEYCRQESPTNCTVPDQYAARPPLDEIEAQSFFSMPQYTGFFRFTSKNNCTLYPNECTGHIMDFPCGWTSYVTAQTYHLGISLESNGNEPGSNGYAYEEMVEIISAANATKSDLIFFWWNPDALSQEYIGTDTEFTQITLPPVNTACNNIRISPEDRCSLDLVTRVGDPTGVCQEAPHPLKKLIASGLYQLTYTKAIPEPLRSPAYQVLQNFLISGPEIGQLFENWRENKEDPRTGVCTWIVDNFEQIESMIPRGYPRELNDSPNPMQNGLSIAAGLIASLSVLCVVAACALTYEQRDRRVIKFAQMEFLWVLLCGLLLVSIGSLLIAVPPKNGTCVAIIWTINIGYSLELVPLIVKMTAFYRLMRAAKRLRHVKLTTSLLFGWVVGLTFLVVIFLSLWTALDPPEISPEYNMLESVSDDGNALQVFVTHFCESYSQAWSYAAVGWHLVLLAAATVQAVHTRSLRKEINESQTLAVLIYSHAVFVVLRLLVLLLDGTINRTDLANASSLIFAVDVIATIGIYFFPKFLAPDEKNEESEFFVESSTVRHLQMLAAIATRKHEEQLASQAETFQKPSIFRGSTLLPDPTKHKELKNLRNITSTTFAQKNVSILERTGGTDGTASTHGATSVVRCSLCGCNMHCPSCDESVQLLVSSDEEDHKDKA